MTKNEALKKCIDGAKITHPTFAFYEDGHDWIEWDGRNFMRGGGIKRFIATDSLDNADDWEFAPRYVDFTTAWKAYESDGKTIKSCLNNKYSEKAWRENSGPSAWFTPVELGGKWLILEDENK